MNGYKPTYNEIINNTGTPAYVFDLDVLRERLKLIKSTLGSKVGICYAMKANPFVVGDIDNVVDRYEVCSHGEFRICEKAGIPMNKVVLSGVYKEPEDTKRIVATYKDAILYTAESINQFHLINESAIDNDIIVNIILRITTGNQFGIDESDLIQLIADRDKYKGVDIVGIQHFSGTQRKNLSIYKEELEYCDSLIERLRGEYEFEAKELEFGTGFFFEYFQPKQKDGEKISQDESELNARAEDITLLEEFASILNGIRFKGKITLEIGRFIVASCGRYYTSIVDKKHNCDIDFCIVDGGIHQLNYFGQMLAMKKPWYRQLKSNGEVYQGGIDCANVCGSLCTTNDNLVKGMPLTNPELEDIIEFRNSGAYSMTEASALFLSRDLPKVFLYEKEKGLKLMRDRFEAFQLNYICR
ncbi:MAG: alanine racemase [Eubacteriales bacterium]|nr:alanine racemase [Eubacteriales bacterium]MDY3332893.1 alanine racemase [Gallibacter sp.]